MTLDQAVKIFALVVLGLGVLAVIASMGGSDSSPSDPDFNADPAAVAEVASESDVVPDDDVPPGYYPPEESTAVGMTPEWRDFADTVDRICALSFNYAMAEQARTQLAARRQGWSDERAEAAVVRLWGEQTDRIVKATARLGPPPERPVLYQRWRANVRHRSNLFFDASAAAAQGNFLIESSIHDEIHALKLQSDKLGQRFGLRICTSN